MILRQAALLFGLLLGFMTSQLPEFAQQYRQRLGGAVDELNRVLDEFDADAARLRMSREQGMDRLARSSDAFVSQRADRLREDSARAARLERQLADFRAAGPIGRLGVMARDFDVQVASRAWGSYEPAVPVTVEGALIAIAGFFTGWGFLRTTGWAVARRRRRNQKARA